jgi:hypothetical protein
MLTGLAALIGLLVAPRFGREPGAAPLEQGITRARMGRHGAGLMGLARSVVLLDLETTARLARQIDDDEAIAVGLGAVPPDRGDPGESFQALAAELRTRAGRLADEAGRKNDLGVADTFGELARTCVRCHRLYLRPRPRAAP